MAINNIKKRKVGTVLAEGIIGGIRSGARMSVREYHNYKVSDPTLAEGHLLRAVHMPVRARTRLNYKSENYEAVHGVGTFNTYLGECLGIVYGANNVTLGDLNSELTSLEADTATLKGMKTGGSTLDEIAAWIEANWDDERLEFNAPLPPDYSESW